MSIRILGLHDLGFNAQLQALPKVLASTEATYEENSRDTAPLSLDIANLV